MSSLRRDPCAVRVRWPAGSDDVGRRMPPTLSRARLTALGHCGPRESIQGVVWLVDRDARVREGMPALTVGVMRCARARCPRRGGVPSGPSPGALSSGSPEAVVVGKVGVPGTARLATVLVGGGLAGGD